MLSPKQKERLEFLYYMIREEGHACNCEECLDILKAVLDERQDD